jgi:chromosome segregation ATPase
MTEPTLQDKYATLKKRYNSMCEAAEANNGELGKHLAEISQLKNEVIRLSAEARVAQQNAQLLGDDFNERSRQAAAETGELRARLRENGLDTGVH